MKLLFDQNISYRLVQTLSELYPESTHVRLINLQSAGDEEVWNFAKNNDYIIVSKDSDFHQKSFLYGFPPKVIWINKGNCSTSEIEEVLVTHLEDIKEFAIAEKSSFLVLT